MNIYSKEFREFIELKPNNKSFEDVADFFKQIDVSKYNVEVFDKEVDIEKEVKAWRKFFVNRSKGGYKQYEDREFNPLFTKGEIADFIRNKLGIFDENFNLIDLSLDSALDKTIRRIFSRQITLIRKSQNKVEVIKEVIELHNLIQKNLTNKMSRRLLEGKFSALVLDIQNIFSIESMYNLISEKLPNTIREVFKKEGQDKLVDFVFDQLTDYDLRGLPNFPEFSGLYSRFRARWREFLRTSVFKVNRPIKPTDVFDVVLDVYQNMKDEVINSRNIFNIRFTGLLSRAMNKRLSPFNFNENLRALVRGYGRDAFRSGIRFVGLDPDDFRVLENFLVAKMNNYVRFYVTNLTSKVFSGAVSIAQSLIKGESWSNKFINKFFDYGRLAADRNGLYEWVYGDTNHCLSCLQANGQRHLLKWWYKSGILPQSNGHKELICGGFYCQCKLVRVTGKSRGRTDRIATR